MLAMGKCLIRSLSSILPRPNTIMFLWYDYVIIFIVLFCSTLIGIYFGCFGTKQATTKEYLSGGKKMKILPIALSVVVSHFSAITLVGVPADVYKYGAFYWLTCISAVIIIAAAAFIFYPTLFKEEISSIYEYLEKRFDHRTKLLGVIFYIVFENLLLPIVLYGPALALSVVTGFNIHVIAIVICATCVFYTSIGGLRTVIWTDILQLTIIISTFFAVGGVGLKSVGGFTPMWNKAVAGERLDIFDFDLDPTKKDTFWICVIGLSARFLYYLCLSQSTVQKYTCLPSLQECRRSLVISGFCWGIVNTCAVLLGLIVYANFANCDPVMNKDISKSDQIVPYFVQQIAQNVPGVSGLFMAALISAAISTLSSSFNALSGVIYNDFVRGFLKKDIKEERSIVFILKLIVVIEGVVCVGMVSVIHSLGEMIPMIPMTIGITGIIDGPSLGLYTLGVLFPLANATGAFYGAIGGMMSMAVIYFPSLYFQFKQAVAFSSKSLSVDGCSIINATLSTMAENLTFKSELITNNSENIFNIINETLKLTHPHPQKHFFLFRISYNYYCLIGACVTVILGISISWMTTSQYSPIKKIYAAKNNSLLRNNQKDEESQS